METPQSMDASDSGQEPAPDPSLDLSPTSRGRQRKKNSKFLDYEVSEVYDGQTPVTKRSRRAPASAKVRANAAAEEEKEDEDEGGEPEEAPKRGRKRRGRKPWGKKAVGKTSEGGGQDGAANEETPRPKRKYTRRKKAEELQPEREEEKKDDGAEEGQDDWEASGARPKRGAARAALKYLHNLAKDELRQPDDQTNEANGDCEAPVQKEPAWKTPRRRRGYKRKHAGGSDGEEDEEFVPNAEDDVEEEEEEEEYLEEDEEGVPERKPLPKYSKNWTGGFRSDGPPTATLQAVKVTAQANTDYRQKYHSSWVFPDWIPSSSDWQLLPHSEAERYLPEEQRSVAFSVSREGLKKEAPLRLDRFCSVPSHPDRWDSLFFCGGPVWSLEWCPAPDAALEASQFVALSCHRDMDETHRANQLYDGAGLVQIWDVGALQSDKRPDSQPALVYSVAQDRGFVWGLKWCPSGAWEPPDSDRQAPLLPRLGLLAVASSQGVVTVYSLPHPQALTRAGALSDSASSASASSAALPPVFKAKAVVTLRLGSFKAPRLSDSGQVLALDWLPHKPHNIIAIGFYDGHVGLWDVSTRSSLLRVREGDGSMTVLPYECFSAHDLQVTHVSFCPASRQLLVTAGEDRFVKTWDLTRVYEPVTQQKRQLVREVCWPLFAPGFFVAEESGYSSHVVHGVHFYTHYMNALYPIPRSATLWSLAFSDWLNMVVTCDSLGELILCTMPLLTDYTLNRVKRTIESRFPLQFSAMVPLKTEEEEAPLKETVEAETRPTETAEEEEKEEEEGAKENPDQACPGVESYRETAENFYLQMTDFNLKTFMNFHKRPMWKRMRAVEQKTPLRLDHFPMTALHKVRFSPNFSSRTWLISAGQSGIVRLHCIRSVNYKTKTTSKDDPEESQPSPAPETSPSPGHADPAPPL